MGFIGQQAMAAAAAEKRRAEAKLEKARKLDGSHAAKIVERFLSDEWSDYLVLTELGREYGATHVAAALRAELQAAREFCHEAAQRSEFLQQREKFTAAFQLAALRDEELVP